LYITIPTAYRRDALVVAKPTTMVKWYANAVITEPLKIVNKVRLIFRFHNVLMAYTLANKLSDEMKVKLIFKCHLYIS